MTTNIQDSGLPLVFRVPDQICEPPAGRADATVYALRVYVRALEGMQKEALVTMGTPSGDQHTWRMVSDEGPYLNGTDLAPFPLAFFSAGMQFSFLSELLQHARREGIQLDAVQMSQDNFYTMNGSALKGTMIGGALPVELAIRITADAPPEAIAALVGKAEQTSPAHVLMRETLSNTFALTFNQQSVPLNELTRSPAPCADNPDRLFAAIEPDADAAFRDDCISKLSAAKEIHGVAGGAASSLQAEQKRTLHVHGEAQVLDADDMLMETVIQLHKPIGSTFRFVSDEVRAVGGQESAPPPLAYLTAGVGFCYMTQLGRYAHITKQDLHSYQIIQDNVFVVNDEGRLEASPFDTHVFLEAGEAEDVAERSVFMGERTCFLHAAMRTSNPTRLVIELNGEAIEPPV